jgi:chemotaxis protein MotB
MSELNRFNPIIIKKIKKHSGHHGGAWKVAYADFVTAMMALFIVLWVLGQDNGVKEAVAHYFKNPVGFSNGGKNILKGQSNEILNISGNSKADKKENEKEELKKMGEKIISELDENPDFHNLMNQIKVEIVDEGMRIELIDSQNYVFFEIGTATIKEAAKQLLEKITFQLIKIPNMIVIEGHTDSRPYGGSNPGYSNFELSADRANNARKIIVSAGLNTNRIDEVRGYADKRLRDLQDPFNTINRRISIIVKYNK